LKILGVDLAGNSKNLTGICVFNNSNIQFKSVNEENEIINIANTLKPNVIAIDSPIIHGKPRIRKSDIMLKKYKPFPPILPGMKQLTIRGTKLAEKLLKFFEIIEVFPTATSKILGIYHKNFRETAAILEIKVKNKHELDAYLCCLTGKLYLEGKTVSIGDETGKIIIPME
jgi:predicted nuclease with RNAse H fold